jgi:hypothetical protein
MGGGEGRLRIRCLAAGPPNVGGAKNSARPMNRFVMRSAAPVLSLAMDVATSGGIDRPEKRSHAGSGNTHAWLKSGAIEPARWHPFARAEIFALPASGGEHRQG